MTQLDILPFLMFQGNGLAALDFYESVLPDFALHELGRDLTPRPQRHLLDLPIRSAMARSARRVRRPSKAGGTMPAQLPAFA